MYDLVGNPEDPFSHNEAHIKSVAEQAGLCLTWSETEPGGGSNDGRRISGFFQISGGLNGHT